MVVEGETVWVWPSPNPKSQEYVKGAVPPVLIPETIVDSPTHISTSSPASASKSHSKHSTSTLTPPAITHDWPFTDWPFCLCLVSIVKTTWDTLPATLFKVNVGIVKQHVPPGREASGP